MLIKTCRSLVDPDEESEEDGDDEEDEDFDGDSGSSDDPTANEEDEDDDDEEDENGEDEEDEENEEVEEEEDAEIAAKAKHFSMNLREEVRFFSLLIFKDSLFISIYDAIFKFKEKIPLLLPVVMFQTSS